MMREAEKIEQIRQEIVYIKNNPITTQKRRENENILYQYLPKEMLNKTCGLLNYPYLLPYSIVKIIKNPDTRQNEYIGNKYSIKYLATYDNIACFEVKIKGINESLLVTYRYDTVSYWFILKDVMKDSLINYSFIALFGDGN